MNTGRRHATVLVLTVVAISLVTAGAAVAQGPPPVTIGENNPFPPGDWPYGVTSANMNVTPSPGSVLGGSGSDNLKVAFPAGGPIRWTESRHNEGDIAMLIGPHDANDPSYYPPDAFVTSYQPGQTPPANPFQNTTLAWRVSREKGALLATVRHNGRDNGDTFNGTPVGIVYGVAYFNDGFGQGWGYRMNDGAFDNGGGTSADLQMGIAGTPDEGSFDVATAFFPYEEGWLGAWVNGSAGGAGEAVFSSGNPLVPSTTVVWQGDFTAGRTHVLLPGVDSSVQGMLFVASSNSGNQTKLAAAAPRDAGWDVTIRDDADLDPTGQTLAAIGDSMFQFLYIPHGAFRLVGGHVNGATGGIINAAGTNRFSLARTNAGEYALSVLKADGSTPATGDDGMLILSVAGHMAGTPDLADRAFLSYQYDAQNSTFIIQSRELVPGGNIFGQDAVLRDADFYFAFIDFQTPVRAPETACANSLDDDGNGLTDCDDPACDADAACQCNVPFADAEGNGIGRKSGDHDVDQSDFGVFQICFTGTAGSLPADPPYCQCFDREGDGDVDVADLEAFQKCLSGPSIPWVSSPECP